MVMRIVSQVRALLMHAGGDDADRELTTMLPDRICFAASLVGLSLIAGGIGASAQQPGRGPLPAAAAHPAAPAIARPAAPPAMARPAAPPAMARPAAPA